MPGQAWQTIHPPRRGRGLRRPKVHIGFHKSWVANDLHLRIKERVMEIIKDHKGTTKLYITGELPLSCGLSVSWMALTPTASYAQPIVERSRCRGCRRMSGRAP